jgi:hypothetical protein
MRRVMEVGVKVGVDERRECTDERGEWCVDETRKSNQPHISAQNSPKSLTTPVETKPKHT